MMETGGAGYQCEWMLHHKVRNIGNSLSLPLPLPLFVSGIPCLWLLLFADTSIMKRLYYCLSTIDSTPALVRLGFPSFSPRGTQPGLAFGALLYLTATGVPPSGGGGVYVLQNIPACCPCLRPCQRTCCHRLCFTTSRSSDKSYCSSS